MHQTTIRFDSQLWQRIETESALAGVSAAQYIRDATLIRLTQSRPLDLDTMSAFAAGLRRSASAVAASDAITTDSHAVWAQARLARERARSLRDTAHRLAESRALRPWAGGSGPGESTAVRRK